MASSEGTSNVAGSCSGKTVSLLATILVSKSFSGEGNDLDSPLDRECLQGDLLAALVPVTHGGK